MSCGATSRGCGATSTPGFTSVPAGTSSAFTPGFVPTATRRKLTAEQKEELQKKEEERAEKKQQRKEIRDEVKADTKAKIPDATSKKAKLRLYITLLKLKLHL
jgi:hypothetical protein